MFKSIVAAALVVFVASPALAERAQFSLPGGWTSKDFTAKDGSTVVMAKPIAPPGADVPAVLVEGPQRLNGTLGAWMSRYLKGDGTERVLRYQVVAEGTRGHHQILVVDALYLQTDGVQSLRRLFAVTNGEWVAPIREFVSNREQLKLFSPAVGILVKSVHFKDATAVPVERPNSPETQLADLGI